MFEKNDQIKHASYTSIAEKVYVYIKNIMIFIICMISVCLTISISVSILAL